MGILGKAIVYKVVKNRAERKAEERILKELELQTELCTRCNRPRVDHQYRMGKYRCES